MHAPTFVLVFKNISDTVKQREELKIIARDALKKTKSKTAFISSVTHELRTPLNGIIGLSDHLLDQELEPEIKTDLQMIYNSGKTLLGLINNVLDYSKLETEDIELENQEINLSHIIDQLKATFRSECDKKGIQFKVEIGDNVPMSILGDQLRLTQVFFNLISNSIKFTSQGSVALKIDLLSQEKNKIHLLFAVVDTGIGIEEENIEKIFKPFGQEKKETARKFGGTGLGLSISQKICEIFGSPMKVKSKFGFGTTFSFELQTEVKKLRHLKDTIKESEKPGQLVSGKDLPLKILIAEDNKVNQIVLKNYLKKLNYEDVVIVENGKDAVDECSRQRFDLLLMDIEMPVLNGVEAAKVLYQKFDFLDIPKIVSVSANNSAEDLTKWYDAGFIDYLPKPVNLEDLSNMIKHLFTE